MSDPKVQQVYATTSLAQQQQNYDEWAADYESDLCAMGWRGPAAMAAVFTRFVDAQSTPILDAGCGGGIQVEPLVTLGYQGFVGIDLSPGMLAVAEKKDLYDELHQATLGERLDFPDDHFAAILSTGVITPGHAPANSFEELTRIAKPSGYIIFSLRNDDDMDPAYAAALDELEKRGVWKHEFQSSTFFSLPYGEPDVTHRIQVYKVI